MKKPAAARASKSKAMKATTAMKAMKAKKAPAMKAMKARVMKTPAGARPDDDKKKDDAKKNHDDKKKDVARIAPMVPSFDEDHVEVAQVDAKSGEVFCYVSMRRSDTMAELISEMEKPGCDGVRMVAVGISVTVMEDKRKDDDGKKDDDQNEDGKKDDDQKKDDDSCGEGSGSGRSDSS